MQLAGQLTTFARIKNDLGISASLSALFGPNNRCPCNSEDLPALPKVHDPIAMCGSKDTMHLAIVRSTPRILTGEHVEAAWICSNNRSRTLADKAEPKHFEPVLVVGGNRWFGDRSSSNNPQRSISSPNIVLSIEVRARAIDKARWEVW